MEQELAKPLGEVTDREQTEMGASPQVEFHHCQCFHFLFTVKEASKHPSFSAAEC